MGGVALPGLTFRNQPNTNPYDDFEPMNSELKTLLKDTKRYIEEVEVKIDGEWGGCRSVEELVKEDAMPELYARVLDAIEQLEQRRPGFKPKNQP